VAPQASGMDVRERETERERERERERSFIGNHEVTASLGERFKDFWAQTPEAVCTHTVGYNHYNKHERLRIFCLAVLRCSSSERPRSSRTAAVRSLQIFFSCGKIARNAASDSEFLGTKPSFYKSQETAPKPSQRGFQAHSKKLAQMQTEFLSPAMTL